MNKLSGYGPTCMCQVCYGQSLLCAELVMEFDICAELAMCQVVPKSVLIKK